MERRNFLKIIGSAIAAIAVNPIVSLNEILGCKLISSVKKPSILITSFPKMKKQAVSAWAEELWRVTKIQSQIDDLIELGFIVKKEEKDRDNDSLNIKRLERLADYNSDNNPDLYFNKFINSSFENIVSTEQKDNNI